MAANIDDKDESNNRKERSSSSCSGESWDDCMQSAVHIAKEAGVVRSAFILITLWCTGIIINLL